MLLKDCVSIIRFSNIIHFSNIMQCEKYNGGDRVLWGKVRKPRRVYKLIMVSRVPGYGHLEYMVFGLSYGFHHFKLICWVDNYFLIGTEMGVPFSMLFQLP